MRLRYALCCAALVGATWLASTAKADDFNKLTYPTFSGPVQVPGVTLPAGTYTFKLADPEMDRHVVQIFEKESNKLITTLMSIPNEQIEAKDEPTVMFAETASGQPHAIKAWFYPNERTGEEFIYPKDQAMRIATATHSSVLAVNDDSKTSDEMKEAKIARIDENGRASDAGTRTETRTASADRQTRAAQADPDTGAQAQASVPAAPPAQ